MKNGGFLGLLLLLSKLHIISSYKLGLPRFERVGELGLYFVKKGKPRCRKSNEPLRTKLTGRSPWRTNCSDLAGQSTNLWEAAHPCSVEKTRGVCGRKGVARLMRQAGLSARRHQHCSHTTGSQHDQPVADNLRARDLRRARPT